MKRITLSWVYCGGPLDGREVTAMRETEEWFTQEHFCEWHVPGGDKACGRYRFERAKDGVTATHVPSNDDRELQPVVAKPEQLTEPEPQEHDVNGVITTAEGLRFKLVEGLNSYVQLAAHEDAAKPIEFSDANK